MHTAQLHLFGHEEPAFDPDFGAMERIDLGEGAWLDLARGWLRGHARLFDVLRTSLKWRSDERKMYERIVDVPRLYAVPPKQGADFPILLQMRAALDRRYQTTFERVSVAYYRDGRDSVAWHGDYVARRMPEALVATVSLGAPRKFLLRRTRDEKGGGGSSVAYTLGMGDLLVMGGTCQRTFQHAIPKVARADARISVMFRPVWQDDGNDTAPRADR